MVFQRSTDVRQQASSISSVEVAGMRVQHWCMLGLTSLLLASEVTISQLCHSLITLVVGFHTFFILMCMALLPQTTNIKRSQPSSLDPNASPPCASSSSSSALPSIPAAESTIKPSAGLLIATNVSSIHVKPPTPQPNHEAASMVTSHELISENTSPPALICGLSHTDSRSESYGAFFAVLTLASLCMSYLLEIISFAMEPQPVQHPQLLVPVAALSLLHKMLVLWLSWDQLQRERGWATREQDTECHLEVNHKALAEEENQGEPRQVLDDVSQVRSAVDDSFHNGALVLCNPGASTIPDTDPQFPEQQREVHPHAAAPQDSRDCEVARGMGVVKACKCESHSMDITEIAKDSTCVGHLDSEKAVSKSTHHTESSVPSRRWPDRLLPFAFAIQDLSTSILGLIYSLVMLLVGPHCLYSSESCALLVYLDPCFATLGVIMLLSIAKPQTYRLGLLLLQGIPPHIYVPDLERRIVSVPGVQAVHDLHIWQLNDSLIVASVHVHCHAGFPTHRCADLMLGVTKVLKSVGVSCCTVQPEFATCSASSSGSQGGATPVTQKEDPSPPPVPTCSLACGEACASSMCCSPPGKKKTGE
ncbi:zinc transporter 10 isoform X1 [Scomber japonicus]|uniref:zinc transporter 10 isoform X1 n=2 Tax=Scomber japonicus TaxID=13676 RepID=UPI0023051D55|nr:zinc transporter 10 isoform X1 [Scomber japonicus]